MTQFDNKLVIDLFKQRDELRSENERLTRKVAELYEGAEEQKQHIKRLKEAGDKMERWCSDSEATLEWIKAKEANKMVSKTPRTDAKRGFHGLDTAVDAEFSEELELELNAANERIKRLEEAYAAKDDQLCNLLNICRSNGIEVSSQDLINGREEA